MDIQDRKAIITVHTLSDLRPKWSTFGNLLSSGHRNICHLSGLSQISETPRELETAKLEHEVLLSNLDLNAKQSTEY